ncbi:Uncharacterised protein [Neisseria meningitidis]|nr:Uncharacterised protein [Neisseria meningitidis]CWM93926.1 Uncharacterised protein [Neisseria meningitidis]CWQ10409.1 Uncharacterised protein [Neisseria meningitidis]
MPLGVFMPLLQLFPMLRTDGNRGITALPIAINGMFADAFVHQFDRLQRLLPKPLRLLQADLFFNFPHTAGVIADNLPATPSRRAETDTRGFQHNRFMSLLRQGQCSAQTTQSAADDTGIGFQTALKFRINSMRINRTKIIRRQIFLKIRTNHYVYFIRCIFRRHDMVCRTMPSEREITLRKQADLIMRSACPVGQCAFSAASFSWR